MARRLRQGQHDKAEDARLLAALDSIKWLLWHGNQHRAGEEIAFLEDDVDGLAMDYANLGKFARAAHEFAVYIASNVGSLINYGERYRAGERISSCLAESTVNPSAPISCSNAPELREGLKCFEQVGDAP